MYEITKPFYNFYSVERSGFLDTGELMEFAVTDMIHNGSFTLANLTYNSITGERILVTSWPPRERFFQIVDPGVGYKVGDTLEVPWDCSLGNATVQVTSIFTCNGGVRTLIPVSTGDSYRPRSSNINTQWPFNKTTKSTTSFISKGTVKNLSAAVPEFVPNLGVKQPMQDGGGLQPWYSGTGQTTKKNYTDPYGKDGSKGRWPKTGVWTTVLFDDTKDRFFVGQEVILGDSASRSSTSVIPPDTTITSINIAKVNSGSRPVPSLTTPLPLSAQTPPANAVAEEEKTLDYTYFTFSNPVTIQADDSILVRGRGLKMTDFTDVRPPDYRVILEAAGGVDPLNDPIGCYGTVKAATSNSEFVEIVNLQTQNAFRPVIHPGQSVISLGLPGNVDPYTTVVESTATSLTSALIKFNKKQTLPSSQETLRFVFDEQQPWRIGIEVERNTKFQDTAGSQKATIYVATPVQLQDNGNIANIWNMTGTTIIDRAGILGNLPTGKNASPNPSQPDQGFINRELRVAADPEVYPMNYQLTMTNRGIFFGIWEGTWSTMQKSKTRSATDKDSYFNWFLCQRPVNRYTGQTTTIGRAPVFCINSVGYKYWQFVVRESDVLHPQQGDPENYRDSINTGTYNITKAQTPYRVPADAHSQDAFAVLNTTNQIAITEDSKYLVSFIYNLASPRFRYSEELDMIGQTSADICMAGNQISINTYNESGSRVYHAMPANGQYNTGLRIAVLKDIPTDIT